MPVLACASSCSWPACLSHNTTLRVAARIDGVAMVISSDACQMTSQTSTSSPLPLIESAAMGRVAVRNVRRDANEHLKRLLKDHAVSEDEERKAQDEVQKMTDRHIIEIDQLLQQKEVDLMAV